MGMETEGTGSDLVRPEVQLRVVLSRTSAKSPQCQLRE